MNDDRTMIDEAALDWVVRVHEADFDAWDGFAAWLGADPRHAEAYHRLAAADADIADLLSMAKDRARTRTRPRLWFGGAVAACVLGVMLFSLLDRPGRYMIETPAGGRRTVTLADGSRITLNGRTRVWLDRGEARYAQIEQGEAAFDIAPDARSPFVVLAGDAKLEDAGTRFNVVRQGRTVAVQVAEGAVVFDPGRLALRLDAGRSLRTIDGDALLALGKVKPASVATWKVGRLEYNGQTIAQVADDLSRWSGRPVRADPRIADQRFHGVLSIGDGIDMARLAPLLDLEARRDGRQWTLLPRA